MFPRFVHVVACKQCLILFYDGIILCHCEDGLLICSPADGHLGYFHFRAMVSNAAVNICGRVLVWASVCISLGKIPRSAVSGL